MIRDPFTLLVVDDFSTGAQDLRDYMQEFGDFRTIPYDGEEYIGICPEVPGGVLAEIRKVPGIEQADIAMEFCRRHTNRQSTTDWIHADGGIGNVAAIWYLNPDQHNIGGTAFFRFKKFGWDCVPSVDQIEAMGMTVEETSQILRAAANDESQWEQTLLVPAKWNRLALYPTRRFHARWPREGFGETDDDARLIYVAFLIV
jgi:hypothetical protein